MCWIRRSVILYRRPIHNPSMTPTFVNNPANVYLFDSDANYYYYTTNQTYYIDLLTISNIPYSSIWLLINATVSFII